MTTLTLILTLGPSRTRTYRHFGLILQQNYWHSYATQVVLPLAWWLSPKYRTLALQVSFAQTIELFTHVLSGITITIIPDIDLKYWTVRLNEPIRNLGFRYRF